MSYCRFGSDSDVYVYHDAHGGWTTHISNHITTFNKYSFNDPTRRKCLARLLRYKKMGLKVPQHAIDRFLLEINDIPPP